MRGETNKAKLEHFMEALGRRVGSAGRVYFTGGGTAVLEGWRDTTIDIDLKAMPEPRGFFEAIAELKDLVDLNVELAAPDEFIPELSGWQERSLFVSRHGQIDFFHYDPYSQALAKIERGHTRDLSDVDAMLDRGLIVRNHLWRLFLEIEPKLLRFPAIEPASFRAAVVAICQPPDEL